MYFADCCGRTFVGPDLFVLHAAYHAALRRQPLSLFRLDRARRRLAATMYGVALRRVLLQARLRL